MIGDIRNGGFEVLARAWTEANNVSYFAYGLFKQNQSYQLIQKNNRRFVAIVLLMSMIFMFNFLSVETSISGHKHGSQTFPCSRNFTVECSG